MLIVGLRERRKISHSLSDVSSKCRRSIDLFYRVEKAEVLNLHENFV